MRYVVLDQVDQIRPYSGASFDDIIPTCNIHRLFVEVFESNDNRIQFRNQ